MKQVLREIRKELKANVDTEYKKGTTNSFNEPIRIYGVRSPIINQIVKDTYNKIKHRDKKEAYALFEELLKTNYGEEAHIAFKVLFRFKKQYTKADFKIFERWLSTYVTDWGMCDDFCTHAFGALILEYPEFIPKIKNYTKSKNMWVRRGSAVMFIYPVKREECLKIAFEISDLLMNDKEDLVQKGYGWLLKEASNVYQKEVFNYVMKNKRKMTRTALRYAIEKMPEKMRKKAMAN